MTIFIYGQNVLRGVIEEKQTRVAEVVVSSIRPTTLLAGKEVVKTIVVPGKLVNFVVK